MDLLGQMFLKEVKEIAAEDALYVPGGVAPLEEKSMQTS